MNEAKINSHQLRIAGTVEIPHALTSGYNYSVKIEAPVNKIEMIDNENSTFDVVYKMKPIRVELITETGESIKAKDPRKQSELTRMQCKAIYMEKGLSIDFEVFYGHFMAYQRGMANQVADLLIKEKGW